MSDSTNKIMIVAGEASGDTHAAKLVRELKLLLPDGRYEFFGAAGPKMRETGVEPVVRSDELSIVGLLEIGKALPIFWGAYRSLKAAAVERQPDVVVLVDFPDFNLKLARWLKKQGFLVVYYISPQLWAWRGHRIRTVRKFVDLLITILPFEKDWYARHGIHYVEYVGSPLAREVHPEVSKEEFCQKHGMDPERPIVTLLPGSRHKEIIRILPELLRSAVIMAKRRPEIQFITALSAERHLTDFTDVLQKITAAGEEMPHVLGVTGETYDALNAADAAAVTSGTATLEAGIIGTPMVIVYKTSAVNYKLLRPLIDVEHFGLINLIAGERVATELIQDDFTPETLAQEMLRILEPGENATIRKQLGVAADKLGHGGASKRAAEAIVKALRT